MCQGKKVRKKKKDKKKIWNELEKMTEVNRNPKTTQVHLPQVLNLRCADSQAGGKQGGWHIGLQSQTLSPPKTLYRLRALFLFSSSTC